MTTRRIVLKTAAASIVIAGAGAAGFALTRAPRQAREPWSKAGTGFGDARLDALSYAILAPNPHNMQPWRVRLDGDDALTVFCDASRLLPETDPPNRQITIGFGCFLELLRQAAAEKGLRLDATPFPQGEPQPTLDERPIASVRFVADPDMRPDALFAAALSRRTNRAPYRKQRVEENLLDEICKASVGGVIASGVVDGDRIKELRDLANDAWNIEWTLDRTRRESIAVTRIGKKEVDAAPWGLALNSPLIDAIAAAGVMTRDNMDQPDKAAYEQSLIFYQKAVDTAAAFVWTSTATNTRADQLNAGAAWVRMQQAATLAGVAFHPLSQALQEFPEMAPAYDRAHEMLAHQKGATVQMLARLGYADAPPPAPREALMSKIIRA
jgi:hypothetical protein